MPEYRRAKIAGGSYFFTVVTFNRLPILTGETARSILHTVWMDTQGRFPFRTDAVVLLPDPIASSGPCPKCAWLHPYPMHPLYPCKISLKKKEKLTGMEGMKGIKQ
jgi:hypothetical protein